MASRREPSAAACESLVSIEALEDWLRKAAPGDWLIYQRGPYMLHDAVTRRIGALAQAGIVDPLQPRSETRSGCRDFKIQLRSKAMSSPAQVNSLSGVPDEATDRLLTILRRDANLGHRCRTNQEMAQRCGLATTNMLAWRLKKLERDGLIRVDTIESGPEAGWRTVTIVASGKQTQPPPSVVALRRSIAADAEGGAVR